MLGLLVFVVLLQSLRNEEIPAISAAQVLVLGLVREEAVLLQSYFFLLVLQPVYYLFSLFSVPCILKEVDDDLPPKWGRVYEIVDYWQLLLVNPPLRESWLIYRT